MAALIARLEVARGHGALFWSVGAESSDGAPLEVHVTDGARLWAGTLSAAALNANVTDEKTTGKTLAQAARRWCAAAESGGYYFALKPVATAPTELAVYRNLDNARNLDNTNSIRVAGIKIAEESDPVRRAAGMVALMTSCVDAVVSQAARAESLENQLKSQSAAFEMLRTRVGDKNQALAAERAELASNFLAVLNAKKKAMRKLRRKLAKHNLAEGLGEIDEEEEAADSDSSSDKDGDGSSHGSRSSGEGAEESELDSGAGRPAAPAAAAPKRGKPDGAQRPDKKPKPASAAQDEDPELTEEKRKAPLHWSVVRPDKPDPEFPFRYNINLYCVVQDTTTAPLHYLKRFKKLPEGLADGLPPDVVAFINQHRDAGVELHDNTVPEARDELVQKARNDARKRLQDHAMAARTRYVEADDELWPA